MHCRYQMCVLLLFNRRDAYTYDEIKEETSIPDRELTRALQPLSIGKVNLRNSLKYRYHSECYLMLLSRLLPIQEIRIGDAEPDTNLRIAEVSVSGDVFGQVLPLPMLAPPSE